MSLVLGLGNTIMADDGVGPRVIHHLQATSCPRGVAFIDGGTLGLDLLPRLEGIENLVLIDAVDSGLPPGMVTRFTGDELAGALATRLSPHQVGVEDLLAVARLQGCLPRNVVLWGVQPERLEVGLDLSPVVDAAVPVVAGEVLRELERCRGGEGEP